MVELNHKSGCMVVVLLLLFLRNICIYLNKLVLRIYNSRLITPKYKTKVLSNLSGGNNQYKNYRSGSSGCGSNSVPIRARLQEGEGRGKKSTAMRKRHELKREA